MWDRIKEKNLPLMQSYMRKDPESYKSDFLEIFEEFKAIWNTFLLNSSCHEEDLVTLSIFIAQILQSYKEKVEEFSNLLMQLLSTQAFLLDSDMRLTFCKCLILMRNKSLISPISTLQLFFNLFRCNDKVLRSTLRNYIVQDVRNINKKKTNPALNTALQNYMYKMLQDQNSVAARLSLEIVVELYQRKVWNNSKTANIIASALFSKDNKLVVAALNFFIGGEKEDQGDESSDEDFKSDMRSQRELQLGFRVGKKTKKRQKRLKRALENIKDQKKKRKKLNTSFSAIHLLNDPQELAERLFGQVERPRSNDLFELKLLKIHFVSQLIAVFKLLVLQFYPLLDRFMRPSQREVTKLLLYLAQACHDLVPPDIILTSLKTIANNFVSERNSNEVMAVGINGIREICKKCPLAMNSDLLHDLTLYKKHRDKCVSMAAQSLIGLFRLTNPSLLHKNFRGKPTLASSEQEVLEYGQVDSKQYIPGSEVLKEEEEQQSKSKNKKNDRKKNMKNKIDEDEEEASEESSREEEEEEEEKGEEEEEEEVDEDDGSWVDVSHSEDEENENKNESLENMTLEEKIEKSKKILENRILTDADFKQIRAVQQKKNKIFFRKGSKETKKRKNNDNKEGKEKNEKDGIKKKKKKEDKAVSIYLQENQENRELIPISNIENIHKKRKHDKQSRLATVLAGREGREKFGSKKGKINEKSSKSNQMKKKNKNFMMMRPKIIKNKKQKATFQEKKEALKKVLLRKLAKQSR